MSSDIYAWDATTNLFSDPRNREFPRSMLRWGMALTANSRQDFKIAPAGLASFLDVKVGGLWTVIGHPNAREKQRHEFARLDFPYDQPWKASASMRLEACYLPEGTRMYVPFFPSTPHSFHLTPYLSSIFPPNTPYFLYSTLNTVCSGGYFFATSTLRDSCYGLLHDFIRGPPDLRHGYPGPDAWTLLRRLVHFYHKNLLAALDPCECLQSYGYRIA